MRRTKEKNLIFKLYADPRYKGKHVIVVKNRVYSASTAGKINRILDSLMKKSPKETPTLTYIPKHDTLILMV